MRLFLAVLISFILLCGAAGAEKITGTWSGSMEKEGIRILTIAEDGSGSLTVNGDEKSITWDEAFNVYSEGEKIGSMMLRDGFLVFRDASDEVWPLLPNETKLPEKVAAETEADFYGVWKADFVIVSGFRIPVEDIDITYSIEKGTVVCSGTGYENPIPLPFRLSEGNLMVETTQTDMQVVLSLRKDGSMTREMTYMTIHFTRQ